MQLLMTTVGNISYSKHLSLGLFEHLKYFIAFKFPNANTIRFNSIIQNGLEKYAPFLGEVLDQSKNNELF